MPEKVKLTLFSPTHIHTHTWAINSWWFDFYEHVRTDALKQFQRKGNSEDKTVELENFFTKEI